MRGNKLFIRLRTILSILTVTLFVTSAWAATQEKVLYSFNNNGTDGYNPYATLARDAAGNLYGTTLYGGIYPCFSNLNCGTVFELTPAAGGGWTEKVLHNFNGTDGSGPYARMIFDTAGNMYGATGSGGTYGFGTVFELVPTRGGVWTEKVLHSFNGSDGLDPNAGVAMDATGNVYGTTASGGPYNLGTVFELTRDRRMAIAGWTDRGLHNFNTDGEDGTLPVGRLIFGPAGNLYGTTITGGSTGSGTVFELVPAGGGSWTEQVLHSFDSTGADGTNPYAGVVFDAAGNLYGTTAHGGAYGWGTVYELTPAGGGVWTEQVLHSFNLNGSDGANPYAELILDAAGNLYGTTTEGGTFSVGTVFELTPTAEGGWTEKILYSFTYSGGDGAYPMWGGVISDVAGNLYGTTTWGGTYGYGTVFEITP